MLGLLVKSFSATYQVTTGAITGGKLVTLITSMGQLQSPLNFFGTFYRMIQSAMINSERTLDIFKEQTIVVETEDAAELPSCQGDLKFKDIHFSYDNRKAALTGLGFHCLLLFSSIWKTMMLGGCTVVSDCGFTPYRQPRNGFAQSHLPYVA